jgi:hypothetical protein
LKWNTKSNFMKVLPNPHTVGKENIFKGKNEFEFMY